VGSVTADPTLLRQVMASAVQGARGGLVVTVFGKPVT
jgi:hypothetical protein